MCNSRFVKLGLWVALLGGVSGWLSARSARAVEFAAQDFFWQLNLASEEIATYSAETLRSAAVPTEIVSAAEAARDDVGRIAAIEGEGVTLLGSTQGGALVVVPAGWLTKEDLAGSFGPLYAHTLGEMAADDERLADMPYVAAWRDVVGLFGGQPRYERMTVLGQWAFCAATDDRLLVSEIGSGQWQDIGHANQVVALGSIDEGPDGWDGHDRIFVATSTDELWARRAVPQEINWEKIGHARSVTALCGVADRLYCVTVGGALWSRPAEGGDTEWDLVGTAGSSVAMAGERGRLYYVDSIGQIFASEPSASPIEWQRITAEQLEPLGLSE